MGSKLAAAIIMVLLSGHVIDRGYQNMAFPLGIQLNNPGNIKRTHIHWDGASKYQKHDKYLRFENPYYGIRAIMKILLSYKNIHGIDTVHDLISRYAPPTENFTNNYIRDVSDRTGIFPNEVINIKERDILILVTRAIVIHEQGIAPITYPDAWYENITYDTAADNVLKEDRERLNGF